MALHSQASSSDGQLMNCIVLEIVALERSGLRKVSLRHIALDRTETVVEAEGLSIHTC